MLLTVPTHPVPDPVQTYAGSGLGFVKSIIMLSFNFLLFFPDPGTLLVLVTRSWLGVLAFASLKVFNVFMKSFFYIKYFCSMLL
jgi:hypothetical protein